jgi:hypothetical protein
MTSGAHWVTFTAKDEPTIWLAVHFPEFTSDVEAIVDITPTWWHVRL